MYWNSSCDKNKTKQPPTADTCFSLRLGHRKLFAHKENTKSLDRIAIA